MSQLCDSDVVSTESEFGFNELDHVPLTTRRRLLVSSEGPSYAIVSSATGISLLSQVDDVVKRDENLRDNLEVCPEQNGQNELPAGVASESVDIEISRSIGHGNCQDIGGPGNQNREMRPETGSGAETNSNQPGKLAQNRVLPVVAGKIKVECLDGNLLSSLGDAAKDSAYDDVPAVKAGNCITAKVADDDLEHIVLTERRRMLLRRIQLRLEKSTEERNFQLSEIHAHCNSERMKEENLCENRQASATGNQSNGTFEKNGSIVCKSSQDGSRIDRERTRQDSVPTHMNSLQSSVSPNYVKVKVEPFDVCLMQNPDKNPPGNFTFDQVYVKREVETPHEIDGDELDHMTLSDRMSLPPSALNFSRFEFSGNSQSSSSEFSPLISEYDKPLRVLRPRKRKKTVTDSIETALEEDAPGLLQVLLKQGISVDEIKLYGENDNDAADGSFTEESFSELEAVMSQIFFRRESSIKLPPIRCTKGSKPNYCLACLFSLVEQARYLRFRKWPVEWGWCRDLQSFIFVFERHKRIVMERPEYGYATYFFELVDTSSIGWQIKRLVTAMKLTSCGRVTLIENKPLLVREDLSEGEAKVLMEYGWLPNTGLGTMLNYRDRVVHDRKNEKDTSEWRSKIGKLLMDGYSNGVIVSTTIADKSVEFTETDSPKIKLEMH